MSHQALQQAIALLPLPDTDALLRDVATITVEDNQGLVIDVALDVACAKQHPQLHNAITNLLAKHGMEARIDITTRIQRHAHLNKSIPEVANMIAVASAKGGVGKSTIACNLALALAAQGARVGLLDADIYGPSLPTMLGVSQKPQSDDGKTMHPIMAHGVACMSIGFFADANTPMVWRGPIVTNTLIQLLQSTKWHAIDYLIVDMPPGTGDIQLTIAQKAAITAAVIVTTPQEVALRDAVKGLVMFQKVNIPVLGVVENMSSFTCSACGHQDAIFHSDGAVAMAKEHGSHVLAQLPLETATRMAGDAGIPVVAHAPDSPQAQRLLHLGLAVSLAIARMPQAAPTSILATS